MAQEDDFDADFSAGFSDDAPKPTATPAPGAEDKTGEEVAPGGVEGEQAAPAAEPVYAKITQADYDKLLAQVGEVPAIKAENKRLFDTAFGKMGGMQQLIEQLKSSTAAGSAVTVSEEDFAELAAEYPELAKLQVKSLNAALAKMKATGTGEAAAAAVSPPPPQIDAAKIEQTVEQRIEQKLELKRFARKHPDWSEVVNGAEFKAWIAAQPADVQKGYQESWDSDVTIPILDSFKAARKPAKADVSDTSAVSTRQQRLSSAVTPRGSGGHGQQQASEDDEFLAGFNSP